ncbi:MAG: type II toxin-antitoxin system RelE/ParE family toxin [Peptococcaceae bacterium]|jgi:mRNA-degrading endonuclease RelE of RelBE toxin-antitoxin system|nr:type II toxin-antitoxin system RelE/ParE family toxin [Peptococcaceae bacterium]
MRIEVAPRFNRVAKKLEPALKQALDREILRLADNPYKGDRKKGVLRDVLVEKFEAANDQWLVAYRILEKEQVIQLLHFGQHENFYRDLAKYLK